jgi:hypothetical protein
MPFIMDFRCPRCNIGLGVEHIPAGKPVQCPGCDAVFTPDDAQSKSAAGKGTVIDVQAEVLSPEPEGSRTEVESFYQKQAGTEGNGGIYYNRQFVFELREGCGCGGCGCLTLLLLLMLFLIGF